MNWRPFTVDEFAKVARISLGMATLFVDDLVRQELAEHVAGNHYRLTARAVVILRALREMPTLEVAA